jgi:Leucine-rich repeat (LRR) protein
LNILTSRFQRECGESHTLSRIRTQRTTNNDSRIPALALLLSQRAKITQRKNHIFLFFPLIQPRSSPFIFSIARPMARASQTRSTRDIFNCSEQELTEFPTIPKPNTIATLIASNNFLTRLPEMRSFSILRSLNLSNNQLTDVSSVSSIRTLLEGHQRQSTHFTFIFRQSYQS